MKIFTVRLTETQLEQLEEIVEAERVSAASYQEKYPDGGFSSERVKRAETLTELLSDASA